MLLRCEGKVGIPFESNRGISPNLKMSWRTRGPSGDVVRNSGFLSSGDGGLGESLELHKGCQASFRVSRGNFGLLSWGCRGIGAHLQLKSETQGSSPVATGISGFLLSFNRGDRPHLGFRHGTPFSSRVAKGVSGFLSSLGGEYGLFWRCNRGVRPPFIL